MLARLLLLLPPAWTQAGDCAPSNNAGWRREDKELGRRTWNQ